METKLSEKQIKELLDWQNNLNKLSTEIQRIRDGISKFINPNI